MDIRFYVNNAITHDNMGRLYPTSYSFGEPLMDAGQGEFTVSFETTRPGNYSLLRRILPNRTEIIVCVGPMSDNKILWAGWIDGLDPDGKKKTVTFTATHWRAWPYSKSIPPKGINDANTITNDEYEIAYELIDWATTHPAAPDISHDLTTEGHTRKLVIDDWWSVGTALDTLGKRTGGFEWTINAVWDGSAQKTKLALRLYEPGTSRLNHNLLLIENTDNHTASIGRIKVDGTGQVTRVYATGGGEDPVWAVDTAPNLGSGGLLLLERSTAYGNEKDKNVLFALANAERTERNNPYSTIPISMSMDRPPVTTYRVGDRVRLRILDAWNDLDIVGARIVARTLSKDEGSVAKSTISVDLTDVVE